MHGPGELLHEWHSRGDPGGRPLGFHILLLSCILIVIRQQNPLWSPVVSTSVCRRRLPILLHPDAFLKRRMVINEMLVLDLPPPSLHDLQREGIELLVERGPSFLLNGTLLVTGQIERTTEFEQGVEDSTEGNRWHLATRSLGL